MRRLLAVGTVAAACALAGCSEGGYSSAIEDRFIEGCTKRGTKAYCQCYYDRIKKNLSYEKFKELTESINSSKKAPPGSRKEFNEAARVCRDKA